MNKAKEIVKYSNEMQKLKYYCPHCSHPNVFTSSEDRRLCSYCGHYYNKPKYSVYEASCIARIKITYEKFLMKKEGMKNGI